MKTFSQTKEDALKNRNWQVVDAEGIPLGRLATEVSILLRGKNKPTYTPHVDGGDFVVVLNADKIKLTGNKWSDKTYYKHTGYVGGLKAISAEKLAEKHPERLIHMAVKNMLPKSRLGRAMQKKLRVYAGSEHPHTAQKVQEYKIKYYNAN